MTEQNSNLDEFLDPYFAKHYRDRCYPGLIFQQGKRRMVQINVPANDVPTLLQAKPSTGNDPDSGKNRPEVKGHAKEIKEYIVKRVNKGKPWILGTLTANVSPKDVDIIDLGRGICLVVIKRSVKLDITDGQHRKTAIHELIESSEADLIADDDFPITLVLEGDFNQCQIDFRDMAQTRQLDKSLLLSFGEFEGRVGITKYLVEKVQMFKGKTEKIKGTASKKLIFTSNYIAKMVSCSFKDDPNDELKDYNVEEATTALAQALDYFFSECSQTQYIFQINAEDLTEKEASDFRENCLLGRSVGIEILGRLLYSCYDENICIFDKQKVSQLTHLDWLRSSSLWEGNVVVVQPNPKDPSKPYKITTGVSSINIAVYRAKAQLGWI